MQHSSDGLEHQHTSERLAQQVAELFVSKGLTLAAAESCTGGLISHTLTNVPGSSKFFLAGLCVYSPNAKVDLLGVPDLGLTMRCLAYDPTRPGSLYTAIQPTANYRMAQIRLGSSLVSMDSGGAAALLDVLVDSANDELVWPVLDVAAQERIPVYVHTGPPGNSTPWQVVDLAERYPSVDFIMRHCGATDFWNDVVEAGKAAENVYLESSLARPFLFAGYLKKVGASKGIMGSSAPLNELTFEWEQMRGALLPEQWGDVYGNNLARLLEKRGAL